MLLPKQLDEHIIKRFNKLIEDGEKFVSRTESAQREARKNRPGVVVSVGPDDSLDKTEYGSFVTRAKNLARFISDPSKYQEILEDIRNTEKDYFFYAAQKTLGILKGLREDYESGMLNDLSQMIEANVNSDYLGQAEQLLKDEKLEYIDAAAAVIAGAVLEKALRSLCDRQEPPIPTEKPNGKRKTLGTLIDELSKVPAFSKPLATRLTSYAQIRNAAAHGEFDKFTREDVKPMIAGINDFLADHP